MRFIHSSDLQIGKVFGFADPQLQGLLQEARQRAVRRLGELAVEHGAFAVLLAGDVYDKQQLSDLTLDKPVEAMRNFPGVEFHLMPGNHDHHVDNGLWDRLRRKSLPPNVHLHLAPGPVEIVHGRTPAPVYLLPAPLALRATTDDLTAYMDDAPTPEGAIRIGLAHGSIVGFGAGFGVGSGTGFGVGSGAGSRAGSGGSGAGSEAGGEPRDNYVAPDRAERAGLAYLALGDWHRLQRIDDRTWYSGTPEPDQFKRPAGATTTRCNGGQALLVDIAGPRALPSVTAIDCGRFAWHQAEETIADRAAIDRLEAGLRAVGPDLSRVLLDLRVQGTLTLADRGHFGSRIDEALRAALAFLRLDDAHLVLEPSEGDLDEIDRSGFVRAAADRLREMAREDADARRRQIAERALHRLYLEHLKAGGA